MIRRAAAAALISMKQLMIFFSCLFLMAVEAMAAANLSASSSLQFGFYAQSCPSVEQLVRNVVSTAVQKDSGVAAGLLRLHFHDCFVRGCDASILLDSTPGNPAEKDSPVNNPSLRGFDVIDNAKTIVEINCPGKVSCADILTFAARDATFLAGGLYYQVPAGRRDGRVSVQAEVTQNLPPPTANAQQLVNMFGNKGLSREEMVILSGAHSIGRSHCSSFKSRLYQPDPDMDRNMAYTLRGVCLNSGSSDPTVMQDYVTPNLLDNQYYKNLQKHQVLFTSDQTLQDSAITTGTVAKYANYGRTWLQDFAAAMQHAGYIGVLTGSQGEIRKNCRLVNRGQEYNSQVMDM